MGPHRLPRQRPRPGARPAAEEQAQREQQQPKAHHQKPQARTRGGSRNLLAAALLGVLLLMAAVAPPLARAQEATMAAPFPITEEEEPLPQSGVDKGTKALDQLDVAFTYANIDARAVAGFQEAVTQLIVPFGKRGSNSTSVFRRVYCLPYLDLFSSTLADKIIDKIDTQPSPWRPFPLSSSTRRRPLPSLVPIAFHRRH